MNGIEGGRNKLREEVRCRYRGPVVGIKTRCQQKGAETRKALYPPFFKIERTVLAGNFALFILDGTQYRLIATYGDREKAQTVSKGIAHAFKVKKNV